MQQSQFQRHQSQVQRQQSQFQRQQRQFQQQQRQFQQQQRQFQRQQSQSQRQQRQSQRQQSQSQPQQSQFSFRLRTICFCVKSLNSISCPSPFRVSSVRKILQRDERSGGRGVPRQVHEKTVNRSICVWLRSNMPCAPNRVGLFLLC